MPSFSSLSNLDQRRVLITGAGGGIAGAMADTLAELGADLVLVDRPGVDISALESQLRSRWSVKTLSLNCDLECEEDRNNLIRILRKDNESLNCLINTAAFVGTSELDGWSVPFEQQSLDTWRRAIEVNLTAVFHLSKAIAPMLRSSDGANIINVTSIYGAYGPDWRLYEGTEMGNPAAYSASKGALAQLTRWLATTLAPEIRVNAISPGGVRRDQPKAFVKGYEGRTPLKRMASEDDFRGAVAFLASDLSEYMTGQILHVDGGWGVW